MIEQNAVRGVDAVGFAVVHQDPVGVELGGCIGAARIEWRCLRLRHLLYEAVEFRGRGLIEAGLAGRPKNADGLQETQCAERIAVGGIFGRFERHLHMGLRRKIVDFIGLALLNDANEVGRIGQIAVVQDAPGTLVLWNLADVLDTAGVERRETPLNAVDYTALRYQNLGQIGTILAGDIGDEGNLVGGFCGRLHVLRPRWK